MPGPNRDARTEACSWAQRGGCRPVAASLHGHGALGALVPLGSALLARQPAAESGLLTPVGLKPHSTEKP